MNRDSVPALVLAAGGVLALALAGATINDLRTAEGPGGPGGNGARGGLLEPEGRMPDFQIEPIIPGELVMLLVGLVALVGLIYVVRNFESTVHYVIILAIMLVVMLVVLPSLPIELTLEPIEEELGNGSVGERGERGGDGGGPPIIGDWFPVFLIVGGISVLAVAIAVLASRGGDDRSGSAELDRPRNPDLTSDLGAAAGRAADRLETDAGRENEVYRAWVEMIELLDVGDPRSATPRAFAREATKAGLARDDVTDLTALFEEVRYGDRPATEDRERTAVGILRRIEARYAGASDE